MIFATLGTHEQPMPRLIGALAELASRQPQLAPFAIQFGASDLPFHWVGSVLMSRDEIASYIARADIVISHAGPGSIAEVHRHGRIPIVVPRLRRLHEHVDDHQLHYARRLAGDRQVIVVENIGDLEKTVLEYARLVRRLPVPHAHDPSDAVAEFALIAARFD